MTRKRTGIVRYIGNVVDDTKDFIDDCLDRGRDVEHDMRHTARRAFEVRDGEEPTVREVRDSSDDAVARQLADIRHQLADLSSKLTELTSAQTAVRTSAAQEPGVGARPLDDL